MNVADDDDIMQASVFHIAIICISNCGHVITVGLSLPVSFTILLAVSAAFTNGPTASAVSKLKASCPASGGTYFSMYIRIVAPLEPVPAESAHSSCIRTAAASTMPDDQSSACEGC